MNHQHPYPGSIDRLRNILDLLRKECPWDRKQTLQTLRPQTLEEIYELTDAITEENWEGIKEELGDVLLHLLFYSKIAEEQSRFTLEDVMMAVSNKLVQRHPHIYSGMKVQDEEEVKRNWEKLKLKEGKKSILEGVPKALPAMVKALRLQEKTKQVGFEWAHIEQVKAKVEEEMAELEEAIQAGQQQQIEEEFGDMLFAMVNYARFLQIDPENALERTNKKFIRRFKGMEQLAGAQGNSVQAMSLEELDKLWQKMKEAEKFSAP